MVVSLVASAFFPLVFPSPLLMNTSMIRGGRTNNNLDTHGIKPNSVSSCGLHVTVWAQGPPKINGNVVLTSTTEAVKNKDEMPSPPPPSTIIKKFPAWSMLHAAITKVIVAAEEKWTLLNWKPRQLDMIVDPFVPGRIVQDGLVFQQNFLIRSYEIGVNRTASMEALMSYLQETAVNHFRSCGLITDGLSVTPEMSRRNLILVIHRMKIVVDRYPAWGDVVQVDTWFCASGKTGMRRGYFVRDYKTGQILIRATSEGVMINKQTRKLCKFPEEVREELEPYFMDYDPIPDENTRKLLKLDDSTVDYVRKGLTPGWNDLDVNQHVNNIKYLGWILETTPLSTLESYELSTLILEYRKECGKGSELQSLTTVPIDCTGHSMDNGQIKFEHLLRLESGTEILRGRTIWSPKYANNFTSVGQILAESA